MWRLLANVALAFIGTLATAHLALLGFNDFDADHWMSTGELVTASVVVVASLAFIAPVVKAFNVFVGDFRCEIGKELYIVCDQLRHEVARLLNMRAQDLGVKVYQTSRPWRRAWRSYLTKVAGLPFDLSPQTTGVRWAKGKGVIGRTYTSSGQVVALDIASLRQTIKASEDQQAKFDELPEELQMGLTFEEFEATDSYAVVMASPVMDRFNRYRGCVTLETSVDCYQDLYRDDVLKLLQRSAHTVRLAFISP